MTTFHTFGDSHSSAEHSVWTFVPLAPNTLKTHHIGPVLMYSFGARGLDLVNIAKSGVVAGDWACFCFGEIDCRCHVYKHISSSQTFMQIIDDLVEKYMAAIEANAALVPGVHVAVFMIVPACRRGEVSDNQQFPFLGTDEERRDFTLYANAALKRACLLRSYAFIDAYDSYTTSEGYLDFTKGDGRNHCRLAAPVQTIVEALLSK